MRTVGRQALDRGDRRAFEVADGDRAAHHSPPIDDHGASTAVVAVAAIFGPGEVGRVPERPEQGRVGVDLVMDRLAVDRHSRHWVTLARGLPRCQDSAMPRVITNNGYSIGYSEAGGGEHLPIVFLHGVGSDKSVWRPQLEHFGAERRAIAFDYPG